jgi:hypothetical protein
MRYAISIFLLLSFSRSMGQANAANPRLVNATGTMITTTYSSRDISLQAENWKREKNTSQLNAKAWFNYYLWTERDKQISSQQKKTLLSTAILDAEKYISGTAEYSLMVYLQSGKKDSASLFKALSLANDKSIVYPYVVQYCIIQQDYTSLETYCNEMDKTNPMPETLYSYHYNVLMSADSNAVIYGRGLYDIVLMAQLQYVHHTRKDIRLRYYEGNPVIENNAYLCLSLGKEILDRYPGAAYTGLLVKIKGAKGISELKRHIEKDMNLWFLQVAGSWEGAEQLYKNYLPGFILMYRHYKQTDNYGEAQRMRSFISGIAHKAGITQEIDQLLAN